MYDLYVIVFLFPSPLSPSTFLHAIYPLPCFFFFFSNYFGPSLSLALYNIHKLIIFQTCLTASDLRSNIKPLKK